MKFALKGKHKGFAKSFEVRKSRAEEMQVFLKLFLHETWMNKKTKDFSLINNRIRKNTEKKEKEDKSQ